MNVWFGLMIIGSTMSGKTTVYKSLMAAMNLLESKGSTTFPKVE